MFEEKPRRSIFDMFNEEEEEAAEPTLAENKQKALQSLKALLSEIFRQAEELTKSDKYSKLKHFTLMIYPFSDQLWQHLTSIHLDGIYQPTNETSPLEASIGVSRENAETKIFIHCGPSLGDGIEFQLTGDPNEDVVNVDSYTYGNSELGQNETMKEFQKILDQLLSPRSGEEKITLLLPDSNYSLHSILISGNKMREIGTSQSQ